MSTEDEQITKLPEAEDTPKVKDPKKLKLVEN